MTFEEFWVGVSMLEGLIQMVGLFRCVCGCGDGDGGFGLIQLVVFLGGSVGVEPVMEERMEVFVKLIREQALLPLSCDSVISTRTLYVDTHFFKFIDLGT